MKSKFWKEFTEFSQIDEWVPKNKKNESHNRSFAISKQNSVANNLQGMKDDN